MKLLDWLGITSPECDAFHERIAQAEDEARLEQMRRLQDAQDSLAARPVRRAEDVIGLRLEPGQPPAVLYR